MNGYMYIARGNNMCGIATENYYPNVSVSKFKQVVQSGSNSIFSNFLFLLHLLLTSVVIMIF